MKTIFIVIVSCNNTHHRNKQLNIFLPPQITFLSALPSHRQSDQYLILVQQVLWSYFWLICCILWLIRFMLWLIYLFPSLATVAAPSKFPLVDWNVIPSDRGKLPCRGAGGGYWNINMCYYCTERLLRTRVITRDGTGEVNGWLISCCCGHGW